jgi:hypothetical protein
MSDVDVRCNDRRIASPAERARDGGLFKLHKVHEGRAMQERELNTCV